MNSRVAAQKKIQDAQAQAARAAAATSTGEAPSSSGAPAPGADGDVEMKDVKDEAGGNANGKPASQNGSAPPPSAASMQPAAPRAPYEMLEEISNMLKTAFPLLALMMERMVDHISIRAKPNSEEDIYRFFAALLNDAMQVSRPFPST